jgi:hypothetical protein
MKLGRYTMSAAFLLGLTLLVLVVAGCSGSSVATTLVTPATMIVTAGNTTTAPAETTTTVAEVTTSSSAYDALAQIRAALAASDQIAKDFQVTESKIVDDDWAGVKVHAANVDDMLVLLNHGEGAWSIVTLGSDLTGDDVIKLGAPEEIAGFFGTTQEPLTLSDNAISYARGLEGTSQLDQPLYLVVGASFKTEQEAQAALDKALPLFGDMQANFIIQLSDNFEGFEPGWFVLIEAYWEESNATDSLDFARRAFPDATVLPVTARTSDPIPVYEQLEGT